MNFFKNKKENEEFSSKPIEEKDWFKTQGQLIIDVYTEGDSLVIRAPIAGAKTENINIVIENDMLRISGKREESEEESGKDYFLRECYFGEFSREIVLPVEVDENEAKAEMRNGFLFVTIPIKATTL